MKQDPCASAEHHDFPGLPSMSSPWSLEDNFPPSGPRLSQSDGAEHLFPANPRSATRPGT